jgi:hypothetical protein
LDTININKILVSIISYRDKRCIETIKSAIEKSYNINNFDIYIYMQDSNNREDDLKYNNVYCKNVYWDSIDGFCYGRSQNLKNINSYTHILSIMPGDLFIENWDQKLISLDKSYVYSDFKIDPDYFFSTSENIKQIGTPNYLKKYGESEYMSIVAYSKGIEVKSNVLNDIIMKAKRLDYDYIPFSQYHNYFEIENLYSLGYNKYSNVRFLKNDYKEYVKNNPIKKVLSQYNDVSYSKDELPELLVERFSEGKKWLN